jgi:hypothetical protein
MGWLSGLELGTSLSHVEGWVRLELNISLPSYQMSSEKDPIVRYSHNSYLKGMT